MSFDEELPPSYTPEVLSYCDLPIYSPTTDGPDRLLPTNHPCSSRAKHTYQSKSFSVFLGEKLWGLDTPAYGYDATIQGAINLSNSSISQVSVELQGWISITKFAGGQMTESTRTPLCSKARMVQSLSTTPSHNVDFALPIPHEVEYNGQTITTPASQFFRTRGAAVNVYWLLVVHASRKGLRMNEKYKIPVLYLPKSRPLGSHLVDFPPCLSPEDERLRVVGLSISKPEGVDIKNIMLTLPSIRTLPAGCRIPICITVSGNCTAQIQDREGASFMEALCNSTSVTLVKQTIITSGPNTRVVSSESRVSYVQAYDIVRVSLDQAQLKAWLYAGVCGKEATCNIPGAIRVKYILKIASKPTKYLEEEYGIPSFAHDEELELTTDPWGTSDWELRATCGVPIPALGLVSEPEPSAVPSSKQAPNASEPS